MPDWLIAARATLIQHGLAHLFDALLFIEMSVLCGRAARLVRPEQRAWIVLALIMLALGMIQLFDVMPVLNDAINQMAVDGGWYGQRMEKQKWAVLALAVGSATAGLAMLAILRRAGWARKVAVAGTILLVAMTLLELVSLRRIDAILGHRIVFLTFGALIKGGTTLLIGACALFAPELQKARGTPH